MVQKKFWSRQDLRLVLYFSFESYYSKKSSQILKKTRNMGSLWFESSGITSEVMNNASYVVQFKRKIKEDDYKYAQFFPEDY
jgi:hypothetical protein